MATVTKSDIVAALKKEGIEHDPAASKDTLQALLPTDHSLGEVVVKEDAKAPVDPERQARWDKFLAKVEAERPEMFKLQKELGDFDTIPDSFE